LIRAFFLASLVAVALGLGAAILDTEAADDSTTIVASAAPAPVTPAASGLPARPIVVYHESWDERDVTKPAATTLAVMPAYMNVVMLSFVKPDLIYAGHLDISETGLQYKFSGEILRQSIALLHQRHPQTKVLLSVGSDAYLNWDALDSDAVANLVHDLGADGVDIDYEPKDPVCGLGGDGEVACMTDSTWTQIVHRLRAVLPRPAILTVTGWNVGAFGEGQWVKAKPKSDYTGIMLSLFRSPEAKDIDLVSVMAYDGGPEYDPYQAYLAYRHVFKGPMAVGVQVPPSPQGGPNYTVAMTETLVSKVAQDPLAGAMLYPVLGVPNGTVTPDNPDARLLGQAICRSLKVEDCTTTLP
jgi:hypothetical protein